MITVVLYETNKSINRISISGHAGYAKEGYDIVCSATSMLVINTVNSLEKFSKAKIQIIQKNDSIDITIKDFDKEARVLIDSLILGLKTIQKEYSTYIKITYRR